MQDRKRRPGSAGGTGTDTDDEAVKVVPDSTEDMQQSLKEAADRLEKKKVADALKAAEEQARKPVRRRASCCCC